MKMKTERTRKEKSQKSVHVNITLPLSRTMRRVTGFTLVLLKVRRPGRGRRDSHESGTKKSAKDGKEREKH